MVELRNATVDFGGTRAVGPLSTTFSAGTLTALMGPNGSGKTTLLRLIGGLLPPSSGTVGRPPGRSVAYVAQHHLQHRWMPVTVGEVLRMSQFDQRAFPWPLSKRQKARIAETATSLDVADLETEAFGDLSGGQRQRVLIASAIATQAAVLLLDEPITGLDLPSQQRILDVVTRERDGGRLVILSTHHLDEARRCERVVLLNVSVAADGEPDDVLTADNLSRTFGLRVVSDGQDAPLLVDDHGHGSHGH